MPVFTGAFTPDYVFNPMNPTNSMNSMNWSNESWYASPELLRPVQPEPIAGPVERAIMYATAIRALQSRSELPDCLGQV